ncbi:hypothetical protein [Candidatus Hakubella thermalkaliphila]|nr:hypothetical protein [Candidatus Hakubella thermalkaliphila]
MRRGTPRRMKIVLFSREVSLWLATHAPRKEWHILAPLARAELNVSISISGEILSFC